MIIVSLPNSFNSETIVEIEKENVEHSWRSGRLYKSPCEYKAEPCWRTGTKPPEFFWKCFELPKLVLRLTFLNRFRQRISLVNTTLTSVGRIFGYLFHLSSFMLNGREYKYFRLQINFFASILTVNFNKTLINKI